MNQLIKIGLGLAIAIIFPLMVGLGVEAFYPSPPSQYEKCERVLTVKTDDAVIDPIPNQEYQNCLDDQEKLVNTYNRNLFLIITVVGFAAIAGGALYFKENLGPVAPGLVFGGLFTILYGSTRSFNAVDKRWLFLELVLLLIGLIFVTMRFLKTQEKK